MQLSVIIVNYNVRYFLEQCLLTVLQATESIAAEIFVVDNCSSDDSVAFLQPKFPQVHFIANSKNVGFGKANNQALALAKGKYVLFLNPDTLLPEDCLQKSLAFIEATPDCGAMGIQMLDGTGVFLPESKRSFPSPLTSFFKLTGLARLFPHSAKFNKYALGHLDKQSNHQVDVLAGAFMLCKTSLMQQLNGFDERFFMYGEDVDLSYRVQQAGFKNYYFAGSSIIHFKGESTKRGSLNYVKMFYEAMIVFVSKHYSAGMVQLFSISIKIAIWFRALISLLSSFVTRWGMALIDAGVVGASLYGVKYAWVHTIRHGADFSPHVFGQTIPFYIVLFVIASALADVYDNLYKPLKVFFASTTAMLFLLAGYALFPEQLRFSRGVILLGGIVAGIMIALVRWLFLKTGIVKNNNEHKRIQQTVIVADSKGYAQVMHIMQSAGLGDRVLGRIKIQPSDGEALCSLQDLSFLLKGLKIREVIFCQGSQLSFGDIFTQMELLPKGIYYRFFVSNSSSILGSDSKATTGEIVTEDGFFLLATAYQKRMKRLLDICFACLLLICFPITLTFVRKSNQALSNCWRVFIGKATFVGYAGTAKHLPNLPNAVFSHTGNLLDKPLLIQEDTLHKMDKLYAKDYDWLQDAKLILQNLDKIGG